MKSLLAVLVLTTAAMASSYYQLSWVKNVDQNLYSANSGGQKVLIQTRLCLHIAVYQNAVLKYEPYAMDNKLIFDDDSVCDVDKVLVH